MPALTATSAELSVPDIGLCHVTSNREAQAEARHYAKLGHTARVQPYHYSHSLTSLTYVKDSTSPNGYNILKGLA